MINANRPSAWAYVNFDLALIRVQRPTTGRQDRLTGKAHVRYYNFIHNLSSAVNENSIKMLSEII